MSTQALTLFNDSGSRSGKFHIGQVLPRVAALFGLLALVNWMVSPADPGWLSLNPTPWLVLPVLFGVRYGVACGFGAGLLTALLLVAGRYLVGQGMNFAEHAYAVLALPLFGGILGVVSEGLRRREVSLKAERDCLRKENRRWHADRELLVLARQDLQQRLELQGGNGGSLDEGVAELLESSDEFIPEDLLNSLSRTVGAASVAVYKLPAGSKSSTLVRVASVGESARFPGYLVADDHQIVSEALERKCFLVQKSLLESPPSSKPGYLAAYPISGPDRRTSHVLILQDLPLERIASGTFDVMKSMCDRAGGVFGRTVHDEVEHRSISQLEFYAAMETAVATHDEYAIPSILVRVPFDFGDGVDPAGSFRDLLELLPQHTLLSNSHEEGQRSLLFLLPANSDPVVRDGLRDLFFDFVEELGLGREHSPHFVMTAAGQSPQQLWGKLVATDQDVSFR